MARCQSVRGVSSYQTGRQLPDDQIIHLSTYSQVSGYKVGLESPLRMVLTECDLDSRKVRCDEKNFCTVQIDWEVGVLFLLRIVHLMCTRCVTVRRVCIKKAAGLKRLEKPTQKLSISLVKVRWGWRVRGGLYSAKVALHHLN